MKRSFKDSWNYQVNNEAGWRSRHPSKAIPGQALSLPVIVERLRAGLPVNVLRSGFNPDGFPKFDDLTTLDQFKNYLKNKTKDVTERINELKQKEATDAIKKEGATQ